MDGKTEAGLLAASQIDHGIKFEFYSLATGSLWRVVSGGWGGRGMSGSDLHFFKAQWAVLLHTSRRSVRAQAITGGGSRDLIDMSLGRGEAAVDLID